MTSQIFYIDPEDDLKKIRKEIKEAKAEKIILVLPEENNKLKNIEQLTILKKEAQSLGKQLSIFSTDFQYKRLAEDCGIELERYLSSEDENLQPKVSDIVSKREVHIPVEERKIIKEETKKTTEEKKIEVPIKEEKDTSSAEEKKKKAWLYTLIFVVLAAVGLFSWMYLPKATITIIPASEEIEFSDNFIVQKGATLNLKEKIIPGELIEKTKTVEKNFLATKTEEKNNKATGTITVYNETSSSYRFILGTRFQSPDGKIFKSQTAINIPAGSKTNPSQVKVKVIADKPGEEYNIAPTTFTLPGLAGTNLYNLISGKSTEAMSGGFVGEAKVVGEDDIDKAKKEIETLEANAAQNLKDEILKKVSPDLKLLLENLIVIDKGEITFDKKAGDIGETFKGQVIITARLLNFNEEDVQKLISQAITSKIKEGVEFEEIPSTQKINYEILNNDIKNEKMEVSFKGTEKVAWKVRADQIKKDLMGMSVDEFENYIKKGRKGKIANGTLELWPFWVNKIPIRENQVSIEIKYQ